MQNHGIKSAILGCKLCSGTSITKQLTLVKLYFTFNMQCNQEQPFQMRVCATVVHVHVTLLNSWTADCDFDPFKEKTLFTIN